MIYLYIILYLLGLILSVGKFLGLLCSWDIVYNSKKDAGGLFRLGFLLMLLSWIGFILFLIFHAIEWRKIKKEDNVNYFFAWSPYLLLRSEIRQRLTFRFKIEMI